MAIRTTWNNATGDPGEPTYDEQDLRTLINAIMSSGDARSATKVRGGVLFTDGADLQVVAPGDYTFTVRAGRAVIPAESGGEGSFTAYVDASETHDIEQAAHSTYSRFDSVYIRAKSEALGDDENGGEIGIVYGTPQATPTAPSIPQNSLLLAVLRVPPAGGVISVDRDARKRLTAPGGVMVVGSESDLSNSLQEASLGTIAATMSPLRLYIRNESSWVQLVDPNSSAWQNVNIAANYTVQTEVPQIKRVGEIVYMRGNFRRTSGNIALNGGNALITIQSGLEAYRPGNRRMFVCAAAGANSSNAAYGRVMAVVNTNGGITFQGINTGTDWASWVDLSAISYAL